MQKIFKYINNNKFYNAQMKQKMHEVVAQNKECIKIIVNKLILHGKSLCYNITLQMLLHT